MNVVMPQPSARLGRLWPIDKLFFAYASIMICLLAIATRSSSFSWLLIFGHIAAMGLLLAIARNSSPVAVFLHDWYLLLYVPFCYKQIPYLVSTLHLRSADLTLAHWDLATWKADPVFWLSATPNPAMAELLQLAYTMFLPGVLALGIVLWVRKSRREFRYGTFVIALTFLLSYLGYLMLPARGPRLMDHAALHPPLQGLWTFHFFQHTLDTLEGTQYDCFPSGHVAVVLVGCFVARRISAPVFYTFSALAALIAFSTVYLRYHYVIDVIAGILLAIVVIAVGPALNRELDADSPH
jgi:membrane-associated phospholipid phosphatase